MQLNNQYRLLATCLVVACLAVLGLPSSKERARDSVDSPGASIMKAIAANLGDSSTCAPECQTGMDENQLICGGTCQKVIVYCLTDAEYFERFGEGRAHATPGQCSIFLHNYDCSALGINNEESFTPEELRRRLLNIPNPTSTEQIELSCNVRHELTHIETGCAMPHCTFEWHAFTEQVACLRAYQSQVCSQPPQLPPAQCEKLQYYICSYTVAQNFQTCRCNTGGQLQHNACYGCYSDCVTGLIACGASASGASAWCAHLDRIYCDGRGPTAPTPTATPAVTPPPDGCLDPETEFDAHQQTCVLITNHAQP